MSIYGHSFILMNMDEKIEYIDRTKEHLEVIANDGSSDDIRLCAREHLYWYDKGGIASNSPTVMLFLKDPNNFIKDYGIQVYGVCL
jgi:uncharacterized protein YcfL